MPLLLLVVLVIAEVYVLITVGSWIGAGYTLLLLVASSVLGVLLLKREGGKALRALRESMSTRRPPHREIADGVLIVVGGLLMLLPGFLSDVVGLLCLLPPTRGLLRRALFGVALRRMPPLLRFSAGPASRRRPPVIEGEFEPR